MASNDLLASPRCGVSLDDPMNTAPEKCRYDAAVEISGPLSVKGGARTTTLVGGQCAVAGFSGTASQIGAGWDRLLRVWLRSSGLQQDTRVSGESKSVLTRLSSSRDELTVLIQIRAPRQEVVLRPSLRHAAEIALRHVDVREFNPAAFAPLQKLQD